ncbi:MAG: PHP domain-containing protein [Pseudomonadota bacterium]
MKLDLHTHCMEALDMISHPSIDLVGEIVERIVERGLDGIAITEHYDGDFGFRVKKIVDEYFGSKILIIPGREIAVKEMKWAEMVELFLPDGSTFRFLPHPSSPYPGEEGFDYDINLLHGIEIANALHDRQINKKKVEEISQKYNLIMLKNSDAHTLEDIGSFHTEISLKKLCSLTKDSIV